MDTMLLELIVTLAKKRPLTGPELHVYMEGLAYCEKILRFKNKCIDEDTDDDPNNNFSEDQNSPGNLPHY